MITARKIMEKAASYLGTRENPAGSNNVIFNTHYYGHEVSGNYPWCCVFVWDVFRMCGASELFYDGKKTAYCPAVQSWGRSAGLSVNKAEARYGDIVLFDWNNNDSPDHIGLVLMNNGNGTITAIEGNTSVTSDDNGGNVMERVRSLKNVCCVIRPTYAPANPFDDVAESDWFYEDVLWAVGAGITNGTGENTFSPGKPCTRAETAAFLHRTADHILNELKK